MSENLPSVGETQGKRRVKYGLNVTVAVVAALAMVVFVNWMGALHFQRFDLTSTRQYTLSPQTTAVLRELKEPYKIVSLIAADNSVSAASALLINRANELLDEYGRYSDKLTIEHIDPAIDVRRLTDFKASLRARYADQLKPQVAAIEAAQKALVDARQPTEDLAKSIAPIIANPDLPDGNLKQNLQAMTQILARLKDDDKTIDKTLQPALEQPLPSYADVISYLVNALSNRSEKGFTHTASVFTDFASASDTPASVKAQLNDLILGLKAIGLRLSKALDELRQVKPVDAYEKLVTQVVSANSPNVVVLLGPKQERVVTLAEMYRTIDPEQAQRLREEGIDPVPAFQGEERITGALTSLGLKVQPLVVFVSSGGRSPLEPGGGYSQVGDRLKSLNFDVQEWSPTGQQGPMGQPTPPGPPPQPKPDQKAIWVILPLPPTNPMNTMSGANKQQIIKLLDDRLTQGDAALVMVYLSGAGAMGFSEADPLLETLSHWGIKPQSDRMLMREIEVPGHHPQLAIKMDVTGWKSQLPLAKAMEGMPTIFQDVIPIQLDTKFANAHGIQLDPLVEFQGEDIWAETSPSMSSKRNPATAGGPFIAVVAASTKDRRLMVVGDPVWASDDVTLEGLLGPNTASLTGALHPGNSEFFVNSIYWLAGLDRLIAASARTQDVRRVEPMSANKALALELSLLIGMPGLAIATGICVWLVRRRA